MGHAIITNQGQLERLGRGTIHLGLAMPVVVERVGTALTLFALITDHTQQAQPAVPTHQKHYVLKIA
jgi:hypothetical protein